MTGFGVALLVVLGASASPHPADLQVEAVTASGVQLPELAEAVARALVAGGARVVLRGPGSGPCERCARVEVTETGPGVYRVDVEHRERVSSTTLRLPAGSQLFDRAHAVAIQARMLMTWGPAPDGKSATARPSRKTEGSAVVEARPPPESWPRPAAAVPPPPLPPASEPSPGPDLALAPPPKSAPVVIESPPAPPIAAIRREANPTSSASDAAPVEQAVAKPADRGWARPAKSSQTSTRPASPGVMAAPAVDLTADRGAPPQRRWPWIPTAVGAGAAVAAGICAVVARDRYNGLADKTQSYARAQAIKSQGEGWQVASFVLAGVAVVGIGTGIVGFSARSSGGPSVSAAVSPVPGGGVVAVAGDLP
jgi:hypothetical protein